MSRASGTRERILAAGTALFLRNGYHGTAIQELSDAVGLARGALYHHIGSKEQLLFAISMSLLEPVTDSARRIVATGWPPVRKLRALARELVAHHAEHQDAWSVVLRESRALSPEHAAAVLAARDAYEELWVQVLAQGTAAKAWRRVERVEVRGILGMLNSTSRWISPDGEMTPAQIADCYVDLLLNGLRPR
jgi:AcrR family transcriptional regulator